MAKILIVEDNQGTNKAICEYMKEAGHTLFSAFTGSEALKIFREKELDIIVLDIMLPEMSGIVVLHEIRKISNIPVIMLTALDDEYTQSNSFDEMADDYITKPFNPLELTARVKTVLRRCRRAVDTDFERDIRGLTINKQSRKCLLFGEALSLTPTEFDILWYLCENAGRVVTSEELFEAVWKEKYLSASSNTVMAHIGRLREKMHEPPRKPRFVKTVWGVGYEIEK